MLATATVDDDDDNKPVCFCSPYDDDGTQKKMCVMCDLGEELTGWLLVESSHGDRLFPFASMANNSSPFSGDCALAVTHSKHEYRRAREISELLPWILDISQ